MRKLSLIENTGLLLAAPIVAFTLIGSIVNSIQHELDKRRKESEEIHLATEESRFVDELNSSNDTDLARRIDDDVRTGGVPSAKGERRLEQLGRGCLEDARSCLEKLILLRNMNPPSAAWRNALAGVMLRLRGKYLYATFTHGQQPVQVDAEPLILQTESVHPLQSHPLRSVFLWSLPFGTWYGSSPLSLKEQPGTSREVYQPVLDSSIPTVPSMGSSGEARFGAELIIDNPTNQDVIVLVVQGDTERAYTLEAGSHWRDNGRLNRATLAVIRWNESQEKKRIWSAGPNELSSTQGRRLLNYQRLGAMAGSNSLLYTVAGKADYSVRKVYYRFSVVPR